MSKVLDFSVYLDICEMEGKKYNSTLIRDVRKRGYDSVTDKRYHGPVKEMIEALDNHGNCSTRDEWFEMIREATDKMI